MKKIYHKPEVEFIHFDYTDIITASNGCEPGHGNHGHHYGWDDPQPDHGNDGGHGHNHGGHGHH